MFTGIVQGTAELVAIDAALKRLIGERRISNQCAPHRDRIGFAGRQYVLRHIG